LFGRRLQAHRATGCRSHTVMDEFYSRGLFIKEKPVVLVTEDKDIETTRFEVTKVVQLQLLTQGGARPQNADHEDDDAGSFALCVSHCQVL